MLKSEKLLLQQLYFNSLTQLPNYNMLKEQIQVIKPCSLLLINIDSFKQINDFYGAKVGDTILIEIKNRLLALLPQGALLYKMHSDEFSIAIPDHSKIVMVDFCNNVIKVLQRKYIAEDIELNLRFTIGATINSSNPLMEADMALQYAKNVKSDYILFDDTMDRSNKLSDNIKWLNIIKKAIESDNIVPFFQPIVNNKTREIEKYECLIRLIHLDEPISPALFLKISKKAKLYQELTKTMVRKSFETFKGTPYQFSINLSIDDFYNNQTLDYIYKLTNDFNIGNQLIIEFTETEELESVESVKEFILDIKKLGAKIAIDDFGSGYSNYSYLLKMNIDILKIDSSLIKEIDTNRNAQIITQTIVEFSKKLNLTTVAEFVHSQEVFTIVKNMNIDYSQGYYFGKPVNNIDIQRPPERPLWNT